MSNSHIQGNFGIDTDTKTAMTGFASPSFARWISDAAERQFDLLRQDVAPPIADVEELRVHYDSINAARLEVARRSFAVDVESVMIDGVAAYLVHPASPRRPDKILISLHGGAFMWGNGAGALIEAVPIAATTGMSVLALEYRLAPEHAFPCAVDDVLAAINHLRSRNSGLKIGVYGCSAGAVLTAQLVSRLIATGERPPEAIAMLHAAGLDLGGDSLAVASLLNGTTDAAAIPRLHDLPYFTGADPQDPLVFPGEHPTVLGQFPPALLISGTRDFAASSVMVMHRRLRAAGREAELVMFDGMWHAHHVDVDLPESAEVFAIMADFFHRRLT